MVILDPHMVHFGNDLIDIDITRRIFSGRKIFYVIIWEPGSTHNPRLGSIYPDIDLALFRKSVVSFSAFGRFFSFPETEVYTPVSRWVTDIFLSILVPGALRLGRRIRHGIPIPPSLGDTIKENYGYTPWAGPYSLIVWASAQKSGQQIAKPALPQQEREAIYARLKDVCGDPNPRLCMMFNRYVTGMEENHDRSATPLKDYGPAMRLLVERGYVILLITDEPPSDDLMESFGNKVVDADRLGVDLDLFRLFVPTEAEICIGETGAGMLLPIIMDRPSLVLNFHSIGCAIPGTWVYPKRVVDSSGAPVPYQQVITKEPYGYCDPERKKREDWVPLTNTSDEIFEAVQCFLEDLSGDKAKAPGEDFNGSIPRLSMFYQYGARISPAFVRRDALNDDRQEFESHG
ncbi:MAG: TIGR04372 family glycosyltransferase [Alphaproteobacteria bacterium]|nr:TIGR04372 family glycosyltransferase [Alphaproteobacteria bacterium]